MGIRAVLRFYVCLVVIRLLLVFSPSYIHPDEFHQNGEVTASPILRVESRLPWEFVARHESRSIVGRRNNNNDSSSSTSHSAYGTHGAAQHRGDVAGSNHYSGNGSGGASGNDVWCESGPYRSALTPLATSGVAFALLASVESWLLPADWALVRPWSVVVAPRLVMFLLSFVVDFAVLVVGDRFAMSPIDALLTAASSHAMLVFHVRTFSNSVESVLLSLLLLFAVATPSLAKLAGRTTSTTMTNDDAPTGANDDGDGDSRRRSSRNSSNVGATLVHSALRSVLRSSVVVAHSALLATIVAIGVWNRFTFVAFALPSIVYVLLCTLHRARLSRRSALLALGTMLVAFSLAVYALALIDELWFGSRSLLLHAAEGGVAPTRLDVSNIVSATCCCVCAANNHLETNVCSCTALCQSRSDRGCGVASRSRLIRRGRQRILSYVLLYV
jgi:hypothetical protein